MSSPCTLLSETNGEYSEVADEDSNNVLLYIGLGSAADEELVDEDSWSVGLLLRDEKNFYGIVYLWKPKKIIKKIIRY